MFFFRICDRCVWGWSLNRTDQIAIEAKRHPPMLSVFDKQGRSSGKELIHWLTNDEKDLAHVHVLINCVEVKPYLE